MLFISPIQDVLSLDNDCRLNKPGTIDGNWSWRLTGFNNDLIDSLMDYGNLSVLCGRSFKGVNSLF